MTTARNRATDYLVLDMATIRFQWSPDQTACAALTARGEIVALTDVEPEADERQVAFRLLDQALDQGQVLRPDPGDPTKRVSYKVALYNPFTAEVSAAPVPDTVTFTDRAPLPVPADGLPVVAVTSGRNPSMRTLEGRHLPARTLTFAGLTRAQIAHQAA